MKTIKVKINGLSENAKSEGLSLEKFAEKFVSKIRSISLGRSVCAHYLRTENGYAIFQCD